jgi:xanthine dehydrogenase accessory factor
MKDIFQAIVETMEKNQPVALATVVRTQGSTPREAGAKMLVYADGSIMGTVGGSAVEGRVIATAQDALADGRPRLLDFDLTERDQLGMLCGGQMQVFVDVITPAPQLVLFGAGHVAQEVARIGAQLGFAVVVVDDRPEWANAARFSQAQRLIVAPLDEALAHITFTPQTYIAIMTGEHSSDEAVLRQMVGLPVAYLGLIGSRRKIKTIFERLRAAGVPEEQLARVHAPIGLPIGGETPAEIAVSIAAEMVQVRWRQKHKGIAAEDRSTGGEQGCQG